MPARAIAPRIPQADPITLSAKETPAPRNDPSLNSAEATPRAARWIDVKAVHGGKYSFNLNNVSSNYPDSLYLDGALLCGPSGTS